MPPRQTDRDDGAPVLVDQFLDNGLGLRPYCECGHTTVIPPEFLSQFARGTPIEAIKRRLKCQACGRTGIATAQVVAMSALSAYPRG